MASLLAVSEAVRGKLYMRRKKRDSRVSALIQGSDHDGVEKHCFTGGPTCQECIGLEEVCGWCIKNSQSAEHSCIPVKTTSGDDMSSSSFVPFDPQDECERIIVHSSDEKCDGSGEDLRKATTVVDEEEDSEDIPTNDAECLWDYSKAKCEYSDVCEYRYRFGDLTLSQSCRFKASDDSDHVPTTDAECLWSYGGAHCEHSEVCEYHYRFGDLSLSQSCRLTAHKTPESDEECHWNAAHARCADTDVCEYRFEMGDMNLGQSCRLIAQQVPTSDGDCKWDYAHAKCALPQFCEYHFWVGDMTLDQSCVVKGSRDGDDGEKPASNDDCKWDYKDAKCAWSEVCSYQYHFGDVTLGHSCRLRSTTNDATKYKGVTPTRDGDCDWDYSDSHCAWPEVCTFQYHTGDLSLSASCRVTERPAVTVKKATGNEKETIDYSTGSSEDGPPTTDDECTFSGTEMRCNWPEKCFYKLCAGDTTLSTSCRLRENWMNRTCSQDPHAQIPTDDDSCSWDYGDGSCKYPEHCQYHYCAGDMSLDESCRFALEDRTCNQTKYAAYTGLPETPLKDDDCSWDFAMGECTHLRHCAYHYCAGDMTLSASCRLRMPNRTCQSDDDRAEEYKDDQDEMRAKRIEAARIKRLRIEKRASEEKAAWKRVLDMVRKEELDKKFEEGAERYEKQLDAVSWAEKAAVLDQRPVWPDLDSADVPKGGGGDSKTAINMNEKIKTRVDSTLKPLGLVAQQSRRQATERKCSNSCKTYAIGQDAWDGCMKQCLFPDGVDQEGNREQ
eukprot:g254.t1